MAGDAAHERRRSHGIYGVVCKPDFSLIIPYEAGALQDASTLSAYALLRVHRRLEG